MPKKRSEDQTKVPRGSRAGGKKAKSPEKISGKERKRYQHFIFRDWCKACRICAAFCPKGVIGWSETNGPVIEKPEECIGCRFCERHCPDFAITIQEEVGERSEETL